MVNITLVLKTMNFMKYLALAIITYSAVFQCFFHQEGEKWLPNEHFLKLAFLRGLGGMVGVYMLFDFVF